MNSRILVVFISLFLAACANPDGTHGEVGSLAWFDTASQEQIIEHFTRKCEGYGFERGSVDMAQCIADENRSVRSIRADFFN
ncbi:hypothetical protein [Octadecabacter antarcticus]|uniref:hypothetical protein n=1 Tax=Octadecabacter antarcticus TaxID=1217908 RepID=UPI001181C0A5|nr:hypothetical protein [Octadecabacter antarcticus]